MTEDNDSRTVEVVVLGIAGEVDAWTRTWDRRGNDEIAVFPAEDDQAQSSILEFTVHRNGDCGPHPVIAHYESRDLPVASWHRGEVCVKEDIDCHDEGCPIEDPDPFAYYWCDEPPAPCESDSE